MMTSWAVDDDDDDDDDDDEQQQQQQQNSDGVGTCMLDSEVTQH